MYCKGQHSLEAVLGGTSGVCVAIHKGVINDNDASILYIPTLGFAYGLIGGSLGAMIGSTWPVLLPLQFIKTSIQQCKSYEANQHPEH